MNAILGLTHLVLKTDLMPKQREHLTKIETAAKSLMNMILNFIDLAKLENNRLVLEPHPFDPVRVVEQWNAALAVKARKKMHLEFRCRMDPRIPRSLVGDSKRLLQILDNLGDNAVKFTEKGDISLRVDVVDRSPGKATLCFTLQDTGIGLDPPVRDQLFQSFFQGDGSTTRRYGGAGLGLAISHRLATLMGGEIRGDGRPGEGSTFTFTIPFGVVENFPPAEKAGSKTPSFDVAPELEFLSSTPLVSKEPPRETTDRAGLRALLETLLVHVNKRDVKRLKALLDENSGQVWPGHFGPAMTDLIRLISRYKYREAASLIEALIVRLGPKE
jgi:hypothetical protein